MQYHALRTQLDSFYKNELPARAEALRESVFAQLDEYDRTHPGQNAYRLKAKQYETIANSFTPVLFEELPFFYETGALVAFSDGKFNRGAIHANGWVYLRNQHLFETSDPERFQTYNRHKNASLYMQCGPYCDLLHFGIPMEKVFRGGLKSAYEEIQAAKTQPLTDEESDFLESGAAGLLALKKIAEQFANAAEAAGRTDLASIARRVPWNAPQTFWEGLCTLAFMRKCLGALEGIGFSSFGRPDVLLAPLYESDRARGISDDALYDLVCRFLLIWDCALDRTTEMKGWIEYEYENTLTLGGCDRNGTPVWNGVTRLFLRAQNELSILYPKYTYRYSANSPQEYLEAISAVTLSGKSLGQYENDDCMIPAQIRSGIAPEDACRYVVGGCWDVITPECSKKLSGEFFHLLRPLEWAIHRPEAMQNLDFVFDPMDDASTFEEFYCIYLKNVEKVIRAKAELTATGSRIWHKVAPVCLVSALMEPCIPNKRDLTDGGGRYNWECSYFLAFPDVVDSLLAVKTLCFDEHLCTLPALLDACRQNWPDERLRQRAIAAPSYGDGTEASAQMAARLHNDLYRLTRDLPTAYGGQYHIGYNIYTEVIRYGQATAATPNGRRSGAYLSQSLTPSRLQAPRAVTDTFHAISKLDLTASSGNSVANLLLPLRNMTTDHFTALLRSAAQSGAQALQINCVDRETLLAAQKDPDQHRDIIVRVYGFSAPFVSLSPQYQEEFLSRNFY